MLAQSVAFSGPGGFNVVTATFGGLAGYGSIVLPGTALNLSIGNNNQDTTYSGVMSGGSASIVGITKIGSGTLALGGISTFGGLVTVNSGTLQTIVPNALLGAGGNPNTSYGLGGNFQFGPFFYLGTGGNNIYVNNGGAFDMYGLNQVAFSVGGNGTIATGANAMTALNIDGLTAASNAVFSGSISGSGGLTKTGASTSIQILTGFNTYTGPTTIGDTSVLNTGILQLSFTNMVGTNSNIVSNQSALVLNGGNLVVTASNAPNSVSNQAFNGTNLIAGTGSYITLQNSVGSATLNVNLGAINRQAGSLLTISVPLVAPTTLTTSSTGVIAGNNILTDANGTAYAVTNALIYNTFLNNVNINVWAGVSNGVIVAATPTFNPMVGLTSATNGIYTVSATLAPNQTIGSINFSGAGTPVLTLSGTNVLASGGVLETAGTAGVPIIQGGILQGPSNGEFVFTGPLTAHSILVQSVLANGANGPTGVTVNMPGFAAAFNANMTYTGPTTILQGGLSIGQTVGASPTANASIASTTSIYINTGASLNFDTIGTTVVNAPITLNGLAAITLDVKNNANVVLNGVISGTTGASTLANAAGTITIGAFTGVGSPGTLTLNAANTFAGATAVNAASIILGNNLALENSVVTVAAAGTLQFTVQNPNIFGLATTANGLPINLATTTTGAPVTLTVGNDNTARALPALFTDTNLSGGSAGGGLIKVGTAAYNVDPAANTGSSYTGGTSVANGTLTLTFAAAGSNASVLYNGVTPGALTLGGSFGAALPGSVAVIATNFNPVGITPTNGNLTITASISSSTNTQNFGGLILAANTFDTLTLTNGPTALNQVNLNVGLGAITRNAGSILNIANAPTAGGITSLTTSSGSANSILTSNGVAYGFVNLNDWAAVNGSNQIVGLSTIPGGYTPNAFGNGVNTDVISSFTATAMTTNSIRFNSGTPTVTLVGGGATTTLTTGGVLVGSNSGAGQVSIVAGTGGSNLAAGNGEFVFIQRINQNFQISANLVGNSNLTTYNNNAGNGLNATGELLYTGTTTIASGMLFVNNTIPYTLGTSAVVNNGTLQFNSANTFTLNAPVSGAGVLNMIGGSYVILNGQGTYTGTTGINNGTVQLGVNNALSPYSALTMTSPAMLDLHGFNQTIGSLTGAVAAGAFPSTDIITNNGASTSTSILTVGTLETNTVFNGQIQDGTGAVALVKVGTGSLTLAGPNTYTGGTTVAGGTLSVIAPTGVAGYSPATLGTGPLTVTNMNTGIGASVVLSLSNTAQTVGSLNAGITDTIATPSSGYNTAQISLGPNNTLTINQTVAGNFGGNITGTTGSLVLGAASTATLTLSSSIVNFNGVNMISTNSYGGSTTINGGTLAVDLLDIEGSAGGVGSGIGASGNAAGNLILNGGTLQYIGATGTTDRLFTLGTTPGSALDASGSGSITWNNVGAIGFSTANVATTLTLIGTGAGVLAPSLGDNGTGPSSLTKTGTGTWALAGSNTYSGATTISAGTLEGGAANAFSANSAVTMTGASILDLNGFNQTILSLSSAVGTTTVTNSGASSATLTIANGGGASYAGVIQDGASTTGLALTSGTQILAGAGLNTYSGATTINGGTLQGGATNAFSANSAVTLINAGILDLGGFSQIIPSLASSSTTASVINSGAGTPTLTVTYNGASPVTYGGLLGSGGGSNNSLGLLVNGTGTFVLTNANSTYTGGTTITSGTLNINSDGNLGATSGQLNLNGGTLQFVSTGGVTLNSARPVTLGGGAFDTNGNTDTIASSMTGTTLIKNGAGTLILTGTNTYTTATTINVGTVQLGAAGALANVPVTVASGAALDLGGTTPTNNPTLNLNGQFSSTVGALTNSGSAASFGGPIVLQTASSVGGAGAITLSNSISGSGLTIVGAGTVILTGANSYTTTTISSGSTLQIGNATTTGSLGSGPVSNGGSLIIDLSNAFAIGAANAISGNGSLTQAGAGNTTLSAANSYSGGTFVTGGTLTVSNTSALAGGSLNVGVGTTFVQSYGAIGTQNLTTLTIGRLKIPWPT